MPADHDQEHRRALGHYTGTEGGLRSYNRQILPLRPAEDSVTHDVRCDTCNLHLRVEVMSAIKTMRRRLIRLGGAVAFGVAAILVLIKLNAAQEDPNTFQYPAWVQPLTLLMIVLALGAVSLLAFGVSECGVRIVSRTGRGQKAHWIVRARPDRR